MEVNYSLKAMHMVAKPGLEPRSTDRVLLVSLKTRDFLKFLYKAVVLLLVEVIHVIPLIFSPQLSELNYL